MDILDGIYLFNIEISNIKHLNKPPKKKTSTMSNPNASTLQDIFSNINNNYL